MKRKIISLLLVLIIAFGTMPLSTVFAVDTTSVVVTADKTSAYPGDTVLFTVSVGAVNHLMGAEFVLSIPSGMTYTLNSAAVAEGLAGKVGFVSADWTESTMKFTAYGDGDYSSADLTDFLTFSCKIDDNTLGKITPQITDVVLSDTNFEEISTSVNTDGAVVTVSAAPVSATGVTLNKNTLSLYTGDSETLIANLIPANSANKTVSWKSDDTSVATVDDNGKVTAIKKGSTTVTVTTADGGFTDTCTVDVACSHSNKTVHPAVASTCLVGGNGEYTTCDDCGEVISGSSAQLPLGDHNYIENVQSKYLLSAAQCNKKAVYYKSCSVCGIASSTDTFEYGEFDLNNHIGTTYIKNQKEATCYEEGYTGDTYCSGCDSKLSSGTVIGKNAHNPASVWSTDENYHWHNCQTVGCGNLIDKSAHIGGEATCINKAICSVCNVEYGVLDTNNHKNTKVINAKAATCCENGYTGDTYCNDCNTIISSGTVILASGEHTDADGRWETDGTNHWHTCYYGTKFDLTAHSGGTATCKDKAVCLVCGAAYGELDAHNHTGTTYKKNQKEATCYEEGYTGDTYCSDCNAKLSTGTVIEKNAHNPASTWSTDADFHWHDCQTVGCGNLIDKAAHTGGEATCIHKAVCSVCNVEYGSLDSNNHKNTEIRNAKAATCCEDGYTGDTYCKDCNKKIASGTTIPATGNHIDANGLWETDGTAHWHTCSYGTKFDVTSHSGGTATCKDKAVCLVCGAAYGELDAHNHTGTTYKKNQKEATCYEEGYTGDTYCSDCNAKLSTGTVIEKNAHNPASTWSTDADFHWHDCQTVGCGNLIDKAAHTGGEATCIHKAVCSVCNAEYGSLNPSNHKNTEIRNAKAATCCEDGYTGDTYCKDCNKKIASGTTIPATGNHIDANGLWETDGTAHWHTCSYGTKFDITSHSGGTATCKDKAVCLVCGVAYGELDASNHVGGTEIRDAVAVSCEVDGYTGDTYCKGCGVKVATGQSIPKTAHTIKEWTVTKEATTSESGEKIGKCTSCGQEFKAEIAKLSSNPIAKENTEYKGMNTAPQLEPEGQTVLPTDIIFVAERIEQENLSTEQKTYVAKAIEEVNKNLSTIVGNGKKAESIDVICVLDLSLLIHNYDAASGEDLGYEEYHFDGSVKVTIEIPDEMKSAKNPCLIHIKDDGTCEIVPFTDNGDGTISFTATGFNNYVLVDIATSDIQSNQNGEETSPQTGDDSNFGLWIILMIVSAFGIMFAVIIKKRKVR